MKRLIQLRERAIQIMPKGGRFWAKEMNRLGDAYGDLYERTLELADLDKAFRSNEAALDTTSTNDPDYAAIVNSRGVLFKSRFFAVGMISDLEDAIQFFQEAADHLHEDTVKQADIFNNLGAILIEKFRSTEQIADIDEGIGYMRRALDFTKENVEKASSLYNLAGALQSKYTRIQQLGYLDEAIQNIKDALQLIPQNHPYQLMYMAMLGTVLERYHQATRNVSDLESAIKCGMVVESQTSADEPTYAVYLEDLGRRLNTRYERTQEIDDLNHSIQYRAKALDYVPRGRPERALHLYLYGSILKRRWDKLKDTQDLYLSTKVLQEALGTENGRPIIRIRSGRLVVATFTQQRMWKAAAKTLDQVIELFPQVISRSKSREDLQHTIFRMSGIASLAASTYLKAGYSPYQAVEAIEKCRGLIASLMMDTRQDASALRNKHPDIWSKYENLREQISRLESNINAPLEALSQVQVKYVAITQQRQQLYQSLDDTSNRIRQLPGFENFLLPPSKQDLERLAADGALVTYNISAVDSEAFVITTKAVRVIPLPELNAGNILRYISRAGSHGNQSRRDAEMYDNNNEVPGTPSFSDADELMILWNTAVKPVLAELGLLRDAGAPPLRRLPRIWWVGGGVMARMPLHAAGDHFPDSTENTMSYVVSSYTPSLKYLQFIKDRPAPLTQERGEIAVVSMPTTPGGHAPLSISEEVEAIKRCDMWTTKTLDRPRKAEVLAALSTCTMAHFACHGISDATEPGRSALILGKDIEERLTVKDLDGLSGKNTRLIYLSACSTAEIKAFDLVDEGIHLSSSFQLAGFQHVIGTLWGADDDAAAQVASKFYEGLGEMREEVAVAEALHNAVLQLKESAWRNVSRWAPFIHLGS